MNIKTKKNNWTKVKFGDVVRNANSVERDPKKAGIERIVGLEHLDPGDLHIHRWNDPENGTSFSRKFVPGQTLFGKRRAYQRKVAFAEFEGICSGDILTFEPVDPEKLLPELLPFICQSEPFLDHALGTSAGSLSPRTSWKALSSYEFSLPPIKEQKRIAELLWAADLVYESYRRLIDRANQYYLSLIDERLFSEEYKTVSISDVAIINKNNLSDSNTKKTYQFSYIDISAIPHPKILGNVETHKFATAPSRARRCVENGDILVSTVRPNLKAFVRLNSLEGPHIASTGFAVISPRDHTLGSLIFHSLFSRRFSAYCEGRVTGTSYPAISAKDIASFTLNLPETNDLRQIISRELDGADAAILNIQRHVKKCQRLRNKLVQRLLEVGEYYV